MTTKTKKRIGVIGMAAVMVAAVGASAGTTLAKYVSSYTTPSQSATVAKWGFTLNANAEKMFSDQYGVTGITDSYAKAMKTDIVVQSNTGDNLVAPGTTGEMAFTINGTAQVNAVLTLDFTALADEAFTTVHLWDGSSEDSVIDYYPIQWTMGGEAVGEAGKAVTAAEFAAKAQTILAGKQLDAQAKEGKVYVFIPANKSLTGFDLSIGWKWAYETTAALETEGTYTYNVEDTLLGYLSYGAEYSELSEDVTAWLAPSALTTLNEKKAALATAQADLAAAETALERAQAAVAQATTERDAAQVAFDAVKALGEENAEYIAANEKLQNAETALTNAKEALGSDDETKSGAYLALANAETALTTAQGNLKTAQENFDGAAEELYEALGTYSSWKISNFSFSAMIEQVQATSLNEFLNA